MVKKNNNNNSNIDNIYNIIDYENDLRKNIMKRIDIVIENELPHPGIRKKSMLIDEILELEYIDNSRNFIYEFIKKGISNEKSQYIGNSLIKYFIPWKKDIQKFRIE